MPSGICNVLMARSVWGMGGFGEGCATGCLAQVRQCR